MKKYKCIIILAIFVFPGFVMAQYSTKKISDKQQAYTDSLKQVEYNYKFPILGQGAYSRGFDIPYPVGAMANFIWIKQNITIDNMQLGVVNDNVDIPLTPVDFISFEDNINESWSATFRPDIWILPFLNVYALIGSGRSKTTVNVVQPINLTSEVEQNLYTRGFGILAAGGIGPVWTSVDWNMTWSDPELLDEPVRVNVLGLRVGKTFTFSHKPERNIAVWVGAMRTKMESETVGQIALNEAIPDFDDKTDQIVADYTVWKNENYDDLNFAQKKVVDEVFDPIVDAIDRADGDTVIRYGMDKQVQQLWNGTVGGQYQFNKKWQVRFEAGVVGNRESYMASLNYRFLW